MVCGATDKSHSESSKSPRPWDFNAVFGNVAGLLLFGLVVSPPGSHDHMLQLYLAGTTPNVGGNHDAFASGCFSRSADNGSFFVSDEVANGNRELGRQDSVND